jgi:hypothetical protein
VKTARSLLEAFQKSPRRPDDIAAAAAAATADDLRDRFHLAQTVSLGLAAISGMAERVMLRAVG